MIRYMVVKDNTLGAGKYVERDTLAEIMQQNGEASRYAIYACEFDGDCVEILARTPRLDANRTYLEQLVHVLNESDVDPIHLGDIVEDALSECI